MWTVKEFVEILKQRQKNEFDVNIAVTGKRGDGKSTFINKVLLKFKDFNQEKCQVYDREKVIELLSEQKFGYCWDDEGINTAYKRDFHSRRQQDLIKIITAYRDNFNMYMTAIPFFYSLDKDLREMIFCHIHIIERGKAVILIQLEDSIHMQDPWDTKNNQKKEEKWQKIKRKNPKYVIPYHELSTFVGYVTFGDLTPKQKKKYKEIKKRKRHEAFIKEKDQKEEKEKGFIDELYDLLKKGDLDKPSLENICKVNHKKFSSIWSLLHKKLRDDGLKETLSFYLKKEAPKEPTSEGIELVVPVI